MRPVLKAVLTGALVGALAATATPLPFGEYFFLALALSAPAGTVAGMFLGFVAQQIQPARPRRFALVAGGPMAVFTVQFLGAMIVLLFFGERDVLGGAIAIALLTMICAIPGVLAGAFVLDYLFHPWPPTRSQLVHFSEDAGRQRSRTLERRLGGRAGEEDSSLAERALADEASVVRLVALRWIAAQHAEPFPILHDFLGRAPESDLRALTAALDTALSRGAAERSDVEAALLDILRRGNFGAQEDATIALGDAGGPRALDALAANLAIGYLTEESALAMRRIRDRLPNAIPGQLSMADEPSSAGALSVPVEIGKLSL